MSKLNCVWRRALPVVLACSFLAAARAQDKPVAPIVVGRASLSSIDDFNKFLTDLGIPLSPTLDIKGNLEQAPFLGVGSIAANKPLGITVLAGDPHKLFPFEDSIVGSIPLLPGKITAADLTAKGTAIDGTTDSFQVGDVGVRRTADYLHAKAIAGTFGLSVMNDALFAPDFKDAAHLLVFSADFAVFRKSAPIAYKDLAKQITALPRMIGISTPDDTKPVESALDKVDQFALALTQDNAAFHLQTSLSPSPMPGKAKEALRPAFPMGTIVKMHLVYPTPESAAYLEKQLDALPEDTFDFGMPPVYHQRAKDLVLKLASLNTRADALSVAISMKGGQPVVYLVEQFNRDVNAFKEISDIATETAGLAQEGAGEAVKVQDATYTVGNQKVQRLTLSPEAAPGAGAAAAVPAASEKIVIDGIQTGRTLYLTIATSADGKYVADLANAGMDGKSTALCTGAVDLVAALTAAAEAAPSGGLEGITPEQLQKLKAAWTGLSISWTVQSSEQSLTTDWQFPKQVVRDLVKQALAPSPAPATPATNLP